MKDPFNLFIAERVDYCTNNYYLLMLKTKRLFFEYLKDKKALEEFKIATSKIWDNLDHNYMKQAYKELADMISARDLTGREIINAKAVYDEVFGIVEESKFFGVEEKYKVSIENFYKSKLKTINKDYIDDTAYLTKLVDKYEDSQQIIPYYNKDGTIRSWHNISSYSSMLFNTNLTRTGWNRTLYDSTLLGQEIFYLPAHIMACPLCQEWQGKLYSKNGKSGIIDGQKYQPMENAIEGGIGHPNCKHQWTIYWSSEQLQKNTYSSDEWVEMYEIDQKVKGLNRKQQQLTNDLNIYENIGNQEEVDKISAKIKKINESIKELNE